ncbi:uncharacterized protein RJT21DRAFT_111135 [Scheffersomyces amazonensis]|uniref:uncharacterized protein n=1 Tax=Scheffersomyces amazonensis TaxID=1078765 RepID=UPI00315D23DA
MTLIQTNKAMLLSVILILLSYINLILAVDYTYTINPAFDTCDDCVLITTPANLQGTESITVPLQTPTFTQLFPSSSSSTGQIEVTPTTPSSSSSSSSPTPLTTSTTVPQTTFTPTIVTSLTSPVVPIKTTSSSSSSVTSPTPTETIVNEIIAITSTELICQTTDFTYTSSSVSYFDSTSISIQTIASELEIPITNWITTTSLIYYPNPITNEEIHTYNFGNYSTSTTSTSINILTSTLTLTQTIPSITFSTETQTSSFNWIYIFPYEEDIVNVQVIQSLYKHLNHLQCSQQLL